MSPSDHRGLEHAVLDLLRARLETDGWRRRPGPHGSAFFTHPVGPIEIVTAQPLPYETAEDDGRLTVTLELGLGLEPALGLGAQLPGSFRPALAHGPRADDDAGSSLTDAREAPAVARRLAEQAARHLAWASALHDPAAVFEQAAADALGGRSPLEAARLRYLTAMGYARDDDARAALQGIDTRTLDVHDRRFVLQALAWLDGEHEPPRLEDVVAERPPRPRVVPLLVEALKATDQKRDARLRLERYRRAHPAADAVELRAALAADYAEHGVTASPLAIASTVEHTLHGGWLRDRVEGVEALARGAGLVTRLIRERRMPRQAATLARPESASYTGFRRSRSSWAVIEMDAATAAWLEGQLRAGETRLVSTGAVYVWLERPSDRSDVITAWIGERAVGELDAGGRAAYGALVDLAAVSDERVAVLGGYLASTPPVLSIPLPD